MKGLRFISVLIATFHLALARPETADFVIVGAGTSGCALAGRLCAALPKARIVLLERGQERDANSEFIVRSPRLALNASADETVAEIWPSLPNKGLFGNPSTIVTGKTLGGSSSINGMQWTVPFDGSVDRWNIAGLSRRVAKKFYRRAYRKVGFSQQPRRLRQIYADDFVAASTKVGYKVEFKPFDQTKRFSVFDHSVAVSRQGRRIDSCTAYVSPVLGNQCRNNLKILQGVTVTRLLLNDKRPKRVIGVEYVYTSDSKLKNKKVIYVSKEVLLAAGPYGSPKILQLSGIGPKAHLRKVGVNTKVDIPVGMQTQARASNVVVAIYTGVPLEPSNNATILNSKKMRKKWDQGKTSVLGKNPAAVININGNNGYSAMASAGFGPSTNTPVLSSLCLSNPSSFGYLLIKDSNPFSPPDVQLNILSQQDEFRRVKVCMEKMIKVLQSFPSSFGVSFLFPSHGLNETFIRETSVHGLHFVGGCAVGKVLERDLKVRNVDGVRVIDASALNSMPVSSGPLASTYMLAEYASTKLIKLYRKDFK